MKKKELSMKELDRQTKNLLKVVVIGILLYFGLFYIGQVSKALSTLYAVVSPFIIGGALAFMMSIPTNFFERKLNSLDKNSKHEKLISISSILISWALLIAFLVILINILIPSMVKIVYTFSIRWPDFVNSTYHFLKNHELTEPYANKFMNTFSGVGWYNVRNAIFSFIDGKDVDLFSKATGLLNSVSSGVIGIFTMIVFSIFVLVYKKMLKRNGTRLIYALLSEERADYINKVLSLSYNTFKDYIFSRMISVLCLSVLTFIGMKIFKIPNAPIISIVVGISDLIPIFGPIFGTGFSAILIFVESPFKALIFLAYNVIIQQIQENLIFPYIAGDAIGLPAVWVMASVTIGGSLFGIWGMLISIPVVSVFYTLYLEKINKKLKEKNFDEAKLKAKENKSYTIEEIDTGDET